MSEFDAISGFDGWCDKLDQLLEEAKLAAQNDRREDRKKIQDRLKAFVICSPANDAAIDALDKIAINAWSDLHLQAIDKSLESLVSRQGELILLRKEIQAVAEQADEAAASLRLVKIRNTVGTLSATIQQLNELKTVLEESHDESLKTAIERLVGSMQKVRTSIESKV